METWSLTEYENERQPQEISMDYEMTISPRALARNIVCSICRDVLQQTRAAPDCLHRFCLKCVEKTLKKECPVCRKKLPSQVRSFRVDPNFDQLIAKISSGYHANRSTTDTSKTVQPPPECEIVLKQLHGQQTRFLKCSDSTTVDHLTRYLAMRPEGVKMANLKNNEEYKLCLFIDRTTGRYEMLTGNMNLEEIKKTYKLPSNKPLEFYFFSSSSGHLIT